MKNRHKKVGTTSSTGRSRVVKSALERYWKDMPVVESKTAIILAVNEDDVKGAIPRDPTCCAFSRACARQFDSTAVLFLKQVAYMDVLDSDNVRRVYRFIVSAATRRAIERFDKDGTMPIGVSFRLRAVPKSESLEYNRVLNRHNKYPRGPGTRNRVKPGINSQEPFEVRNGQGQVHFVHEQDKPSEYQKPRIVKSDVS
jgi:hypothetical protein